MLIAERTVYFTKKSWDAVRRAPGLSVLTSTTLAAALLLLGLYAMGVQNLEGLALVWGRTGNISCYLENTVPQVAWERSREALAALPGVDRAELISPKVALQRFRERGPEAAALVEGVADDVLPPAVELWVTGGFVDLQAVARLAERASGVRGVAAVDFGYEEFSRLANLIRLLRYGGAVLGLCVAMATAFIVANTIRLAVYAQRDEVIILRLVGATQSFIAIPFLLQGLLWGLLGSTLGAGLLFAADRILGPRLSSAFADFTGGMAVPLFGMRAMGGQFAFGVMLALGASFWAVRRCRDLESP